eukprot:PhF_6_TR32970/c0_g1_i1/m.48526
MSIEQQRVKDILLAYYTAFNPEMLPYTLDVIKKFNGKYSNLLQALKLKYGPPPSPYRHRLILLFRRYAPHRESDVDMLLKRFVSQEQELIDSVVRMYGPEPPIDYLIKVNHTSSCFVRVHRPMRDEKPSDEYMCAIDRAVTILLHQACSHFLLVYKFGAESDNMVLWMMIVARDLDYYL